MADVQINLKGLDKILKALKGKMPVARIGILANNPRTSPNGKNGANPSNAQIGMWHEFGTTRTPQRSFLRVPLADNLEKRLKAAGALDKAVLKEVVDSGTIVPWLKKVMVVAEGIVADAFGTGGFGKWKPSDMTHKTNHQTLVETTQLRNSITSEVKE